MAPAKSACSALAATLLLAILPSAHSQEIGVSFEVLSTPKADCITNPPVPSASFSMAFPPGTRVPRLYYNYAGGSMPGAAAMEACKQLASTSARTSVVLTPTLQSEPQGNLKVLSVSGNCTNPTTKSPLQMALQLVGSTGADDLGFISCPNNEVCHFYTATTTASPAAKAAAGCVYCGDICRIVVRKGLALSLQSDDQKGPCCDGCSCQFSHYVQVGRLWNRVRTYYHTCKGQNCFPATATVVIAGQGRRPLSALRVGNSVLAVDPATGATGFSEVYAMPHRALSSKTAYLQLTDSNNRTLALTPSHLVYVSPAPSLRLSDYTARPASALRPGQYVWSVLPGTGGTADMGGTSIFGPARVQRVDRVYAPGHIAPFTLDGTLVVDGVLASSYATHGVISAGTAHAALAPLRWAWRAWPGALRALHRDAEGDSPALLAAGLSVLSAAERAHAVAASL